jgi:hypothetical protein
LLDWVLLAPTVWTTFPAGRGRFSPALGGILKAEGLKPGFPDIFIWAMRAFDKPLRVDKYIDPVCIGIELKAGKNTTTPEQQDVFSRLLEVGVEVYVCKSTHDVIAALDDAGIPRRSLTDNSRREPHAKIRHYPTGSGIPGDG